MGDGEQNLFRRRQAHPNHLDHLDHLDRTVNSDASHRRPGNVHCGSGVLHKRCAGQWHLVPHLVLVQHAALATNPMDQVMKHSLLKARAVLASLPRCTAKSRQTGEPCKLPGTGAGGKCRFHGGRSTGRPPTHGLTTRTAKDQRDWIRLLLGLLVQTQGGATRFFKPGRLTEERTEQLIALHRLRRR